MLEILITGTGHCGTGFAARLLTSAGCRCTHEVVFTTQGWGFAQEQMRLLAERPEWDWRADSSWCGAVYLDRPEMDGVIIVHLVRHPKKVMDSCLRTYKAEHPYYGPHFQWLARHLPEIKTYRTPEDRTAYRFLRMNELVEKRADIQHRIEDDSRTLLDALGVDWLGQELFSDTTHNAHPGKVGSDIRLRDLSPELVEPVREMTERYGYKWIEGEYKYGNLNN